MNDADAIDDENSAEPSDATTSDVAPASDADASNAADAVGDSEPPDENGSAEPAPTEPPGPPDEPPPPPSLEEQLAAAKAEIRATREKMLRVAADFDNFRKRSGRELEDARRRGQQSAIRELLPVFDNLERATQQVGETTDPAVVAQGVRMVVKLFVDTLGRMGIARVESLGLPFDPSLHDGMQHAYSDEHPAGAVAQELQAGYKMGNELIRPALVVVSKGPEPPAEPGQDAEEPQDEGADEPPAGDDEADEGR